MSKWACRFEKSSTGFMSSRACSLVECCCKFKVADPFGHVSGCRKAGTKMYRQMVFVAGPLLLLYILPWSIRVCVAIAISSNVFTESQPAAHDLIARGILALTGCSPPEAQRSAMLRARPVCYASAWSAAQHGTPVSIGKCSSFEALLPAVLPAVLPAWIDGDRINKMIPPPPPPHTPPTHTHSRLAIFFIHPRHHSLWC